MMELFDAFLQPVLTLSGMFLVFLAGDIIFKQLQHLAAAEYYTAEEKRAAFQNGKMRGEEQVSATVEATLSQLKTRGMLVDGEKVPDAQRERER